MKTTRARDNVFRSFEFSQKLGMIVLGILGTWNRADKRQSPGLIAVGCSFIFSQVELMPALNKLGGSLTH